MQRGSPMICIGHRLRQMSESLAGRAATTVGAVDLWSLSCEPQQRRGLCLAQLPPYLVARGL